MSALCQHGGYAFPPPASPFSQTLAPGSRRPRASRGAPRGAGTAGRWPGSKQFGTRHRGMTLCPCQETQPGASGGSALLPPAPCCGSEAAAAGSTWLSSRGRRAMRSRAQGTGHASLRLKGEQQGRCLHAELSAVKGRGWPDGFTLACASSCLT